MLRVRKRNVQINLSCTRTSPQTGQLITSSGNPSLDAILGGLPIGSICLIEEDKYVSYSKVLAKYFLAEGVMSIHFVFLGSLDDEPYALLQKLPKPQDSKNTQQEEQEEESDKSEEGDDNSLRIAWRYNDLPMVNSEKTSNPTMIGHQFNLLEKMGVYELSQDFTFLWNDTARTQLPMAFEEQPEAEEEEQQPKAQPESETTNANSSTIFHNGKYDRLLKSISERLNEAKDLRRTVFRICLTSLGSALWYDDHFAEDILKFLTVLRGLVSSSAATVCFITMPMHLVAKHDESLVAKIRNLVDFSIGLESNVGTERENISAFSKYDGLLRLHKIAAINTLSAFVPETSDLAFKLRRKGFVIEKLHLPPELQEEHNNAENQNDIVPTLSCGSKTSSNASLDF